MTRDTTWKVDVASLSELEIIRLLKELKGTKHRDVVQSLKLELVERARKQGATDENIIRVLAGNVHRGLSLNEIAKEWANIFGMSVKEFKRIANAK